MNKLSIFQTLSRGIVAAILVATTVTVNFALPSHADTAPAAAKITFSFDDGAASNYTYAAPTLAKYGLSGTSFVTTGCVGMTTVPNTCRADRDVKYMTWTQIKALKNTYGWEIGSHTITHPYLATYDASDGQPKPLTQTQVVNEIAGSKSALAAQGINATAFASPYGDYNQFSLETIAKYYSVHRGFADRNNNVWPYNDLIVQNFPVQNPVTVAQVKAKIDTAIANKHWLVLTFHDIATVASTNPDDYQYSTANLEAIASYVKTKQTAGLIKAVNASDGPATSSTNLLTNGGFASGIANGWTTDNTAAFKADSATNGSFPEPAKSVLVSSATKHSHLFSPRVTVDSNTLYVIKSYLNVRAIKSGEIGYYIDEYDASGNWVSGQYKTRESSVYLENINFAYKPTSIRVKTASLQIYTTANSGISAYIDSFQWFPVSTMSTQVNLMPNATFDSGLNNGWKTDDTTNIKLDSANHGAPANPVNSVAAIKTNGTAHLFAPQIAVSGTKSYYLENYLNITANNGGEVGFYIDEYDTAGNWISGQYKATVNTIGAKDVVFNYTPSSSAVAKAGLQVIFTGGNSLSAYFDNSRFWAL